MNETTAHRQRDAAGGTDGAGTGILARLRHHERWLWGLVVVGLVADTALTLYGLQQGFAEGNPIVRSAIGQFGAAVGLLLIKGVALCLAVVIYGAARRRLEPLVPTVIGTLWLAAGVVNLVTVVAA